MSIYTGLINWHRKRRVTEAILNICLGVKNIEEDNTKIVKYKLRAYKILGKRRKETEASTEYVYVIGELTTAVQWQKNIFEDLSNISYIAETNTQDVKFDERTKPLQEKLIEARMLIDSLVTMYSSQLSTLRSISAIGEKVERLREQIREELALYQQYEKLKAKVPLETLAHLEAEWKDKRTFIKIGGKTGEYLRRLMLPMAAALTVGIIYLVIDDPDIRKRITDPKYIALLIGTNIAIGKIELEIKKMNKYRKLSKLIK